MSDQLTPAQEAQVPIYTAKYTAKGRRCMPEGTADRAKAAQAAEAFIRLDSNFDQSRPCIHVNYDPKVKDLAPYFASKPKKLDIIQYLTGTPQDPKAMYIITGNMEELKPVVRKCAGKQDISDALCPAQFAAHAAADAMFQKDVIGVTGLERSAQVLEDFVEYCGVCLTYEKAAFVCDPPVALRTLPNNLLEPIFTNKQAHAAGLTDENGVWLE